MGYIPGFTHDVFVSYAHVDDVPLPGASVGWVTTFVGFLRIRLAQRLGRDDVFSVYLDHALRCSEALSPQLETTVKEAATLMIVLSPGYLASTWCEREREIFLASRPPGEHPRIFVIERDFVDHTARPEEIRDFKGFPFWVRDCDGRAARILGTPSPDPSERQYYHGIDDLSAEINDTLCRFKSEADRESLPVASFSSPLSGCPAADDRQRGVFLAHVTDDLENERNNVKRYLLQAGYNVLPSGCYSLEPRSFRQAMAADIARTGLFVQLLSAVPGKKPVDLPEGYNRLQFDMALAGKLPTLRWRGPGIDVAAIEDADHRKLIGGSDVRVESIEDLKREIVRRLREETITASVGEKLGPFFFVDVERTDLPLAEEVCALLDQRGAEYALPINSEDPAENRRDVEENLSICDAIILIYGTTAVTWVRNQLLMFRKATAVRQSRLRGLAVIEGPPEQKDQLGMKLQQLQLLDCRGGLNENSIADFLEAVEHSR